MKTQHYTQHGLNVTQLWHRPSLAMKSDAYTLGTFFLNFKYIF